MGDPFLRSKNNLQVLLRAGGHLSRAPLEQKLSEVLDTEGVEDTVAVVVLPVQQQLGVPHYRRIVTRPETLGKLPSKPGFASQ
ncbi:MAG: hypothetical protein KDB26_07010 [Microthrixaceae bacterium]|nr:hypothetical protein [Microthrixaceae bacterium]